MAPPQNVRGTVLISSRAVLAASGLFATYEALLRDRERTELREVVAGSWVPFPASVAHYEACEALGLSSKEQFELGQKTGARVNGTLLGTITLLGRAVGVTPWTLIDQLPRFWRRGFDGGEIVCERLGPKEARVTVVEQPLLQFRYFRQGLAGTADAQLKPFCAGAPPRRVLRRAQRDGDISLPVGMRGTRATVFVAPDRCPRQAETSSFLWPRPMSKRDALRESPSVAARVVASRSGSLRSEPRAGQ